MQEHVLAPHGMSKTFIDIEMSVKWQAGLPDVLENRARLSTAEFDVGRSIPRPRPNKIKGVLVARLHATTAVFERYNQLCAVSRGVTYAGRAYWCFILMYGLFGDTVVVRKALPYSPLFIACLQSMSMTRIILAS